MLPGMLALFVRPLLCFDMNLRLMGKTVSSVMMQLILCTQSLFSSFDLRPLLPFLTNSCGLVCSIS